MADKLTGKQQLWADAYIVTLNETESSRLAGYKGDDNALAVQGHHNLRNPKIMAYVRARLEQHAMSAEEVLVRLTDIGRNDLGDCLNSMGAIDPLEAKRKGKSHLIKRFKVKTTTITEKDGTEKDIVETEIEMHDPLSALNLLTKYHDLTNRVKVITWEDQAIADIKAGKIPFEALADAFDTDLATQLFERAGIPISTG
jgi:phage terminase small subunit